MSTSSTLNLGDLSTREIAAMIDDTSSSLHLRFNALVNELCERFLHKDVTLEFCPVHVFAINTVTGELEMKTVTQRVFEIKQGSVAALLPHTKQLGVRHGIDKGVLPYFAVTPSQYLQAVSEADTAGAYERLTELIIKLEAMLKR